MRDASGAWRHFLLSAAEQTEQIPPCLHAEVIDGSSESQSDVTPGLSAHFNRSLPAGSALHITSLSRHTPSSHASIAPRWNAQ